MPIYNSDENNLMHSLENAYKEMKLDEVASYQPPPQMPAPQTGQEVRTAPQPETRKAPTASMSGKGGTSTTKGAPPVMSSFGDQYFAKGMGDKFADIAGPAIGSTQSLSHFQNKYMDMSNHDKQLKTIDADHARKRNWTQKGEAQVAAGAYQDEYSANQHMNGAIAAAKKRDKHGQGVLSAHAISKYQRAIDTIMNTDVESLRNDSTKWQARMRGEISKLKQYAREDGVNLDMFMSDMPGGIQGRSSSSSTQVPAAGGGRFAGRSGGGGGQTMGDVGNALVQSMMGGVENALRNPNANTAMRNQTNLANQNYFSNGRPNAQAFRQFRNLRQDATGYYTTNQIGNKQYHYYN